MKTVKETNEKFQALTRASQGNGKGLDKAELHAALGELIEIFKGVNKKLDALLAKAKE